MISESEEEIIKRNLLIKPALDLNGQDGVFGVLKNHLPERYHSQQWLEYAATITYRMSELPLVTQQEILDETGLDKERLIGLNSAIRQSDFLQGLIVHEGLGKKYWDSVMPLVRMGAVDNVLDHKYSFPLRLAFFPGWSCMFYCGFCGRNEDASYNRNQIDHTNKMYKRILEAMPKTATLSISGGLEPLTNVGIGDLVSFAKSKGIRVPIITNGYLLTPRYLKNQPGLLESDSLRVSLYGVDEESYYFVTRKRGAFDLVTNNLKGLLKLRNEVNPKLNVGLNYVILPELVSSFPKLVDIVEMINRDVDNGPGINFLSLREDFGSVTEKSDFDISKKYKLEGLLSEEKRIELMEKFREFDAKKRALCPDVAVDFGYAISALNDGVLGRPLAKVDDGQMRQYCFPQITVAVDSLGDVFLCKEAGFKDRPGNVKFIAGRISDTDSLDDILRRFVEEGKRIERSPDDSRFMDSFDHLVTLFLNKAEKDQKTGIPLGAGPVELYESSKTTRQNGPLFGTFHQ